MIFSRNKFLKASLGLIGLSALKPCDAYAYVEKEFSIEPSGNESSDLPIWEFPSLAAAISQPVLIRSVELLKTQGQLFIVVTSNDGQKGITQCNDRMPNLVSLLKNLVIPHFVNEDARNLPSLVDNAYRLNSNYKYTGMPLWNCIGSVEIAIWDMLGSIVQKPVHELLGKQVRSEYGVYISDWNRSGDPEMIADQLLSKLAATGAKGVKIKVGGRMANSPEDTAQTKRFIPVLRKKLGGQITIYADANGSYSPSEGIETGKLLEDYGVDIFEEPCNFENEEGLSRVNKALKKINLAGGEQDSSPYKFRRAANNRIYDILQPDVYYNGGILKALQVSLIASQHGARGIAPHTPKADPLIGPFWQIAAIIPNLYGLQECVYNGEDEISWHSQIKIKDGKMPISNTPGLGINYDEHIWLKSEKVI